MTDDSSKIINLVEQIAGRAEQHRPIECKPWWRDPAAIPRRESLYGKHYMRKNIGASIGAGGRAKTSQSHFEALEMVLGRNLATGEALPQGPLRVASLNAEEEQDELDRRIAALCQRYDICEADLGGRLFVISVRDDPLRFATMTSSGPSLNRAALDVLTKLIEDTRADVFMLDPWISFHAVNESVNEHMDLVIKQGLGSIAAKTNSAGEIFHHPGKPKPGQAENTVEDARGASAIIWAVRSARVFNFMTPEEAGKLGIAETDRRRHIRIANGKANMGPIGTAHWIKMEVENLPNGDEVACSSPWKPPNPFQGVSSADMHKCRTLAQTGAYRLDSRSADWFGYAVANVLNIKIAHAADNNAKDLAKIKQVIKTWIKNKVLATEKRQDEHRRERDFVIAGTWSDAERRPDPEEIMLQ
jgi:hypothetical protein